MCVCVMHPDAFYENLKKVRLEDNYIVSSIKTTLHNRVSAQKHTLPEYHIHTHTHTQTYLIQALVLTHIRRIL